MVAQTLGRSPSPSLDEAKQTAVADTIPAGVLILPKMRQYIPHGMTVDTPAERIEELCRQYGVPVSRVERLDTPEQAQQGVKQLFASPDSLS